MFFDRLGMMQTNTSAWTYYFKTERPSRIVVSCRETIPLKSNFLRVILFIMQISSKAYMLQSIVPYVFRYHLLFALKLISVEELINKQLARVLFRNWSVARTAVNYSFQSIYPLNNALQSDIMLARRNCHQTSP